MTTTRSWDTLRWFGWADSDTSAISRIRSGCLTRLDLLPVRVKQPDLILAIAEVSESAHPNHLSVSHDRVVVIGQPVLRLAHEVTAEDGPAGEADDGQRDDHEGQQRGDQLDAQRGAAGQAPQALPGPPACPRTRRHG